MGKGEPRVPRSVYIPVWSWKVGLVALSTSAIYGHETWGWYEVYGQFSLTSWYGPW